MATITGGAGNDTLTGTTTADALYGFEGNDILSGAAGNDTLIGGAGADTLNGGDGTDIASYTSSGAAVNVNLTTGVVSGGDAQGDSLVGIEYVHGSAFNDTLASSTAGHLLQGGNGNDLYIVGNNSVNIQDVGDGYDEVQTTLAGFTLPGAIEKLTYTGTGNFNGVGGNGNDLIVGGNGNDTLNGYLGADTLSGGAGIDAASYSSAVSVNLKTGINTGEALGDVYDSIELFIGSSGNDTFAGDAAANTFNGGSAGIDQIDHSFSSAAVNVNLTTGVSKGGDAEGDVLTSIEQVKGSDYNDTLASSTSGHTLIGGKGDDIYIVGSTGITITEATGAGYDEVQTSLTSFVISGNVEKLVYTGSGNFNASGSSDNNLIIGGIGNDVLSGVFGDDTLSGGNGNDTLIGGLGADVLAGGAGTDTATFDAVVSINLKTGVHTNEAVGDIYDSIEVFLGSSGNDTFAGDASANTFNGGSAGIDQIDHSFSDAAVNVNLTTGVSKGGDAEGDILTSIEQVKGSDYNDTLASATSGHSLIGGKGDDTYIVGSTGITVTEAASAGYDEVQTSLTSFALSANVEKLTYTGGSNFSAAGNGDNNLIISGIGADNLDGSTGNDTLSGGNGNDTLIGGQGADVLVGGAGTDTAAFNSVVSINLKTGVHTGEALGDTFDSIEVFLGSTSSDTFVGDGSANSFNGSTGNDVVDYALSDVAVNVNLTTNGNKGGDAEGDVLTSIEQVNGSAYNDTLASATALTTLAGGSGDDLYIVGFGNVVVNEAADAGYDEIQTTLTAYSLLNNVEKLVYTGSGNFSGSGSNTDNLIVGGIGADNLNGASGNDTLSGGNGNDTLLGGLGADALVGGAGTDTATFNSAVFINLKTGVHTNEAAGDTFDSIEVFLGSSGSDTFAGDASANSFNGNTGTDIVDYAQSDVAVNVNLTTNVNKGGDAEGDVLTSIEQVNGSTYNDTLASATTATTLAGGAGDDLYIIGNGGVSVIEAVDAGYDEVQTTLAAYSLLNNVEKLAYTGSSNFSGVGNGTDNLIVGGIGADNLNGGSGNDTLSGGNGNDTLIGGAGADALIGGAGTDTATFSSAVSINLKSGIHTGEALGDTFDSIEVFLGSTLNDTFAGDATANSFNGNTGTDIVDYAQSDVAVNVNLTTNVNKGGDAEGDVLTSIEQVNGSTYNDTLASATTATTLAGGGGDDLYIVGNAGASVIEAVGGGYDEVQTTLTGYTLGANVEKLVYTGSSTFLGTGGTTDNLIIGGSGTNTLRGEGGDDTLIGGGNNDVFTGGTGADAISGGGGSDMVIYQNAVSINLRTGTHTGEALGDTYESIERFYGSVLNDTFAGDASANDFHGGNGGTDIVDYTYSEAAVSVDLTTGVTKGGDAEGDILASIEGVKGSSFGDTLASATSGHILEGGAGDDVYIVGVAGVVVTEAAAGGIDEVRTSLSNYTLAANVENLTYIGSGASRGAGNSGDNILTGGDNNDILSGRGGNDTFNGGLGIDAVSYEGESAAVSFDFKNGIHGGAASGDVFNSIEIFSGSSGADTFIAGASADTLDGGTGNQDLIDYSQSNAGVNVDLITALASGGDAEGDRVYNFEQVKGSAYNDTLSSTVVGHVLQGGDGDDTYIIGGINPVPGGVSTGVQIIELENGGYDQVITTLNTVNFAGMPAGIEAIVFGGTGNFEGTGNEYATVIQGGNGNDTLRGMAGADTLIGGNGVDTAAYDKYSAPAVMINLKTGVHGGHAAGDVFVSIERFVGTVGADTFYASSGADYFDALGTFSLDGNKDIIDYSLSDAAVSIDLSAGTGKGGDAEGDVILGFEKVVGSSYNDTLSSSTYNHELAGGNGNDLYFVGNANIIVREADGEGIDEVRTSLASWHATNNVEVITYTGTGSFNGTGNASDNVMNGGNGNDTLRGLAGGDTLNGGIGTDYAAYDIYSTPPVLIDFKTGIHGGGATGDVFNSIEGVIGSVGNDTFIAGAGAQTIDGGNGIDIVDYSQSNAGVSVNMANNINNSGGDALGDTILNVEILIGSAYNDTLVGAISDDTLVGGNGNDTLSGEAGNDFLVGGKGADVLIGGNGFDAADYSDSDAGVYVDLSTGNGTGGDAQGDVILNIEAILGSSYDDTLVGNNAANILDGSAGNDLIDGGAGNDIIDGGTGVDSLYGGAGNDEIYLNEGFADGGQDGDFYIIGDVGVIVEINDTGTTGIDEVKLTSIANLADVRYLRDGDDLYITNALDAQDNQVNEGIKLSNWYNGNDNIEAFYTNDGSYFMIPPEV